MMRSKPSSVSAKRRRRKDPSSTSAAASGRRSTLKTGPSDRKSTRLNSSHVSISYAVFCLKKKKVCELTNVVASDLAMMLVFGDQARFAESALILLKLDVSFIVLLHLPTLL